MPTPDIDRLLSEGENTGDWDKQKLNHVGRELEQHRLNMNDEQARRYKELIDRFHGLLKPFFVN